MASCIPRPSLAEADIKAAVVRRLRAGGAINARAVIANEFAIGRSAVRADLAILGRHFIGIEIKSERDTLRRLGRQLEVYRRHFDKTIVVLAEKHSQSTALPPLDGIEVWKIDRGGAISIVAEAEKRAPASINALEALLTKSEHRRVRQLVELATDKRCTESAFRRAFGEVLRERFGATSEQFWAEVRGRKIVADDLAILSRFRARREQLLRWEEERAEEWKRWEEQALALLPHGERASTPLAA